MKAFGMSSFTSGLGDMTSSFGDVSKLTSGLGLREKLNQTIADSSSLASNLSSRVTSLSAAGSAQSVTLSASAAQKLKFWENSDVEELVKQHIEEKQVVSQENDALRAVLLQTLSQEELASLLPAPYGARQLTTQEIKDTDNKVERALLFAVKTELASLASEIERYKMLAAAEGHKSATESAASAGELERRVEALQHELGAAQQAAAAASEARDGAVAQVQEKEKELADTKAHSAATAREANECVLLLEEQLQLTIETKGRELKDLTAKLAETEAELAEARVEIERAQKQLTVDEEESQGKVEALQRCLKAMQAELEAANAKAREAPLEHQASERDLAAKTAEIEELMSHVHFLETTSDMKDKEAAEQIHALTADKDALENNLEALKMEMQNAEKALQAQKAEMESELASSLQQHAKVVAALEQRIETLQEQLASKQEAVDGEEAALRLHLQGAHHELKQQHDETTRMSEEYQKEICRLQLQLQEATAAAEDRLAEVQEQLNDSQESALVAQREAAARLEQMNLLGEQLQQASDTNASQALEATLLKEQFEATVAREQAQARVSADLQEQLLTAVKGSRELESQKAEAVAQVLEEAQRAASQLEAAHEEQVASLQAKVRQVAEAAEAVETIKVEEIAQMQVEMEQDAAERATLALRISDLEQQLASGPHVKGGQDPHGHAEELVHKLELSLQESREALALEVASRRQMEVLHDEQRKALMDQVAALEQEINLPRQQALIVESDSPMAGLTRPTATARVRSEVDANAAQEEVQNAAALVAKLEDELKAVKSSGGGKKKKKGGPSDLEGRRKKLADDLQAAKEHHAALLSAFDQMQARATTCVDEVSMREPAGGTVDVPVTSRTGQEPQAHAEDASVHLQEEIARLQTECAALSKQVQESADSQGRLDQMTEELQELDEARALDIAKLKEDLKEATGRASLLMSENKAECRALSEHVHVAESALKSVEAVLQETQSRHQAELLTLQAKADADKEQARAEVEAMASKMQAWEAEALELRATLAKVTQAAANDEERVASVHQQEAEARDELEQAMKQRSKEADLLQCELDEAKREMQQVLDKHKIELASLKDQSQSEVGLLTEQLVVLRTLQDKTEAELLEAQRAHKASVALLSDHQEHADHQISSKELALASQLESSNEQLYQLETELARLHKKMGEDHALHADLLYQAKEQVAEMEIHADSLKEELEEERARMKLTQDNLERANEEAGRWRLKLSQLESQKQSQREDSSLIRQLRDETLHLHELLEGSIARAKSLWEQKSALEATLEERNQAHEAQLAASQREVHELGLTAEQYSSQILRLQEEHQAEREESEAQAQALADREQQSMAALNRKIQCLESEALEAAGAQQASAALLAKQVEELQASLETQQRLQGELRNEGAAALEAALAQAREEARSLEAARDESLELLKNAYERADQATKKVEHLEARISDMEGVQQAERADADERYKDLERRFERMQKVIKQRRKEYEELQAKLVSANETKAILDKEKLAWEEERASFATRMCQVQKQLDAAEQRADAAESSITFAKASATRGEGEVLQLQQAVRSAEARAAKEEAARQELESKWASNQQELENLKLAAEELNEAREAGRLLQVQVRSLQDKASLAEEHVSQLKEARELRAKAEQELAAASRAVGELEAQVRDAQEELAAAEAIIAEREKELEDYIPKGQLMKVAESNELKVRTLQQELMSAQRELEPLRRLQASHDVALHENQSASSEIKNLQEQVRHLNHQLTQEESSATASKKHLEVKLKKQLQDQCQQHAGETTALRQRLADLEAQLGQIHTKHVELQENFSSWRDRARLMLEEKDKELAALKRMPKSVHMEEGSALRSAGGSGQSNVDTGPSSAGAFFTSTERVVVGKAAVQAKNDGTASEDQGKSSPSSRKMPSMQSLENKVDVEYLRNVVVKYLSTSATEKETRERLLPAMAVLLELNPDELEKVRAVQAQVSRLAPITDSKISKEAQKAAGGFVGFLGTTFSEILS